MYIILRVLWCVYYIKGPVVCYIKGPVVCILY